MVLVAKTSLPTGTGSKKTRRQGQWRPEICTPGPKGICPQLQQNFFFPLKPWNVLLMQKKKNLSHLRTLKSFVSLEEFDMLFPYHLETSVCSLFSQFAMRPVSLKPKFLFNFGTIGTPDRHIESFLWSWSSIPVTAFYLILHFLLIIYLPSWLKFSTSQKEFEWTKIFTEPSAIYENTFLLAFHTLPGVIWKIFTEVISQKWFLIGVLFCISKITGESEHFPVFVNQV